jgi:ATP-dependent Clp protease ATP-binding subunit ClpB
LELEDRLSDKRIKVSLTNEARNYIINSSYDETFGARPIKRYVSANIETLIANNIISDNIKYNSEIVIDVINGEFIIK